MLDMKLFNICFILKFKLQFVPITTIIYDRVFIKLIIYFVN